MAVHGLLVLIGLWAACDGAIPMETMKKIDEVNKNGPYLGIVVPNAFELNPLLSQGFVPDKKLENLDYAGRRFRFGRIEKKKAIMVMTGLAMLNAGVTTDLLLTLFDIEGVVHLGIAGNAQPDLQIGDVTIPRYWSHVGLWNWQRDGDDENNELSLEANGDYTREIGYLKFSDYSKKNNQVKGQEEDGNLLNRVWYQPEEIFPVTGVPEQRQHAFWVPADSKYLETALELQGIELERCANATACLPRPPVLTVVERGCSASTFVDNAAYRTFLLSKFNVTAIDMESAAVALVCLQRSTPFVVIRSLSDLAGGGSDESNEASVYAALAARNAATALVKFVSLLN